MYKRQAETFPVLVSALSEDWDSSGISGFETLAQMGSYIAGKATLEAIELLNHDENIISVEFSPEAGEPELRDVIDATEASQVHIPPIDTKGDGVLIGIIDNGIDVLHETFRDARGKTRILAYWDQTDDTGPAPMINGKPLWGTVHRQLDIDRYILTGTLPHKLDRNLRHRGHGTHVSSIAAGAPCGNFSGGLAPEAKLICVRTSQTDQSIGYSVSHTGALQFLAHEADSRSAPMVVNMSQGMYAGAHDGTCLLYTSDAADD